MHQSLLLLFYLPVGVRCGVLGDGAADGAVGPGAEGGALVSEGWGKVLQAHSNNFGIPSFLLTIRFTRPTD